MHPRRLLANGEMKSVEELVKECSEEYLQLIQKKPGVSFALDECEVWRKAQLTDGPGIDQLRAYVGSKVVTIVKDKIYFDGMSETVSGAMVVVGGVVVFAAAGMLSKSPLVLREDAKVLVELFKTRRMGKLESWPHFLLLCGVLWLYQRRMVFRGRVNAVMVRPLVNKVIDIENGAMADDENGTYFRMSVFGYILKLRLGRLFDIANAVARLNSGGKIGPETALSGQGVRSGNPGAWPVCQISFDYISKNSVECVGAMNLLMTEGGPVWIMPKHVANALQMEVEVGAVIAMKTPSRSEQVDMRYLLAWLAEPEMVGVEMDEEDLQNGDWVIYPATGPIHALATCQFGAKAMKVAMQSSGENSALSIRQHTVEGVKFGVGSIRKGDDLNFIVEHEIPTIGGFSGCAGVNVNNQVVLMHTGASPENPYKFNKAIHLPPLIAVYNLWRCGEPGEGIETPNLWKVLWKAQKHQEKIEWNKELRRSVREHEKERGAMLKRKIQEGDTRQDFKLKRNAKHFAYETKDSVGNVFIKAGERKAEVRAVVKKSFVPLTTRVRAKKIAEFAGFKLQHLAPDVRFVKQLSDEGVWQGLSNTARMQAWSDHLETYAYKHGNMTSYPGYEPYVGGAQTYLGALEASDVVPELKYNVPGAVEENPFETGGKKRSSERNDLPISDYLKEVKLDVYVNGIQTILDDLNKSHTEQKLEIADCLRRAVEEAKGVALVEMAKAHDSGKADNVTDVMKFTNWVWAIDIYLKSPEWIKIAADVKKAADKKRQEIREALHKEQLSSDLRNQLARSFQETGVDQKLLKLEKSDEVMETVGHEVLAFGELMKDGPLHLKISTWKQVQFDFQKALAWADMKVEDEEENTRRKECYLKLRELHKKLTKSYAKEMQEILLVEKEFRKEEQVAKVEKEEQLKKDSIAVTTVVAEELEKKLDSMKGQIHEETLALFARQKKELEELMTRLHDDKYSGEIRTMKARVVQENEAKEQKLKDKQKALEDKERALKTQERMLAQLEEKRIADTTKTQGVINQVPMPADVVQESGKIAKGKGPAKVKNKDEILNIAGQETPKTNNGLPESESSKTAEGVLRVVDPSGNKGTVLAVLNVKNLPVPIGTPVKEMTVEQCKATMAVIAKAPYKVAVALMQPNTWWDTVDRKVKTAAKVEAARNKA